MFYLLTITGSAYQWQKWEQKPQEITLPEIQLLRMDGLELETVIFEKGLNVPYTLPVSTYRGELAKNIFSVL